MNNNIQLIAWIAEVRGFEPMLVLAQYEPHVYDLVIKSLNQRGSSVSKGSISVNRASQYDWLAEEGEEDLPPGGMLLLASEL